MIQAVIFDLDGTLFDSEPLVSKSYEMLFREYGKTPIFGSTGLVQPVGVRGDFVWRQIKERHGFTEDTEVLREKRRAYHLELLRGPLYPMPGVITLLQLLQSKKIKIGLATGSSPVIAEKVLTGLCIKKYFTVIVNGWDFKESKPDPESFLLASAKLHIPPQDCLVIEDSLHGVIKDSVDTDITDTDLGLFLDRLPQLKSAKIVSSVIDYGDYTTGRAGLLQLAPASAQYDFLSVLIPRAGDGDFSEIQKFVTCEITKGNCIVAPTITPTK